MNITGIINSVEQTRWNHCWKLNSYDLDILFEFWIIIEKRNINKSIILEFSTEMKIVNLEQKSIRSWILKFESHNSLILWTNDISYKWNRSKLHRVKDIQDKMSQHIIQIISSMYLMRFESLKMILQISFIFKFDTLFLPSIFI